MKGLRIILCVLLLTCSLTAVYAETTPSLTAAEEKLLFVWETNLAKTQDIYQHIFWALDYVDAWTESRSWQDLACARTACMLVCGYIDELEPPQLTLSSEEIVELNEKGYNVEILESYGAEVGLAKQMQQTIRIILVPLLEEDAFYAISMESVVDMSSAMRQELLVYCQYEQLATNALMLPMFSPEEAEVFWQRMKDTYPVLFFADSAWSDDEAALEDANASLDFDIVITAEQRKESREKIIMTDLEDGLLPELIEISGLPAGLPVPVWYDSVSAEYLSYGLQEDGTVIYPACGDDLTPEVCYEMVQQPDISLEQVEAYVELLNPDRLKQKGNTWVFLTEDGKGVQISWQDQQVQFLFLEDTSSFMPYEIYFD
ncbi:MAG: hypothetical protein E7331_12500 [Clostridiales bacterium]|nr:hypothetical protein [Clostridiales bacterium]